MLIEKSKAYISEISPYINFNSIFSKIHWQNNKIKVAKMKKVVSVRPSLCSLTTHSIRHMVSVAALYGIFFFTIRMCHNQETFQGDWMGFSVFVASVRPTPSSIFDGRSNNIWKFRKNAEFARPIYIHFKVHNFLRILLICDSWAKSKCQVKHASWKPQPRINSCAMYLLFQSVHKSLSRYE